MSQGLRAQGVADGSVSRPRQEVWESVPRLLWKPLKPSFGALHVRLFLHTAAILMRLRAPKITWSHVGEREGKRQPRAPLADVWDPRVLMDFPLEEVGKVRVRAALLFPFLPAARCTAVDMTVAESFRSLPNLQVQPQHILAAEAEHPKHTTRRFVFVRLV